MTRAPILDGTRQVGGVSLVRRTSMRVVFSAIALSAALVATDASAQVNLTGRYRCIELCQAPGGYAYITQNGTEMNMVNDVGEASRAWLDYPGRIWSTARIRVRSIRPTACTINSIAGRSGSARRS